MSTVQRHKSLAIKVKHDLGFLSFFFYQQATKNALFVYKQNRELNQTMKNPVENLK